MKYLLQCACALLALCAAVPLHAASEPDMALYTHYPIFKTEKVNPRIMLALDNSGSMNFPAYGNEVEDWPDAATLAKVYDGRICSQFSGQVNSSSDDGMQKKATARSTCVIPTTRLPCSTLTWAQMMIPIPTPTVPAPDRPCSRPCASTISRYRAKSPASRPR